MRKHKLILIFTFILSVYYVQTFAQSNSADKLPVFSIKTLDGREVSTSSFENDGNPYIVSFWATWCRPCLKELNAIADIYEDWQDMGFKVIAISTDDARTRANVMPMVNGRGWDYEIYHDENGDFRRAMGVNMVPHTFILNGKSEIIHQHTSFSEGMEWEMFDKLKALQENQ